MEPNQGLHHQIVMYRPKRERSMTKDNWHNLLFWWTLSIYLFFKKAIRYGSSSVSFFRQRITDIEVHSVTGHYWENLLRYTPANRSTPRAVTWKWLLKNWKSATRLNNESWSNPRIKSQEKRHEPWLISPQTQHRSPEHMNIKLLTPPMEKMVNLHGFK